jgi:hypothetical protein
MTLYRCVGAFLGNLSTIWEACIFWAQPGNGIGNGICIGCRNQWLLRGGNGIRDIRDGNGNGIGNGICIGCRNQWLLRGGNGIRDGIGNGIGCRNPWLFGAARACGAGPRRQRHPRRHR